MTIIYSKFTLAQINIKKIMKIISCSNAINFVKGITVLNRESIIYTKISHFEDNEVHIEIDKYEKLLDENVLIVQSLSNNVNDTIIELLFTLDVIKNLNPKSINVLLTYMGYSRQDIVENINESFSAKIIANLLSLSYISRIFTIDIHAQQILGFFNVPTINISTNDFIADLIKKNYDSEKSLLVSPDTRNVKNVIKLSDKMGFDYSIAIKYRPQANENKILSLLGHDIKGKDCIIFDDIIDSAGTLCNVAEKLAKQESNNIYAYITHGVLSKKSVERIKNSYIKKLYISNTIDFSEKIKDLKNVEIYSISDYCIKNINKYIK